MSARNYSDIPRSFFRPKRPGETYRRFIEPYEALYRIQRSLVGHVSFLAACEGKPAFTEYLLYEPILRVLQLMKYEVECEHTWPPGQAGPGRRKRIDFVAQKGRMRFALEVKWPRNERFTPTINVQSDADKLKDFARNEGAKGFLCIFGRRSIIESVSPRPNHFSPVECLQDT